MSASLHFVELTVRDWEASLRWYTGVLGLSVTLSDAAGRFALLQAGLGRVALKAGEPNPGTTCLAFEVPDLDTFLVRLTESGISAEAPKASAEGYRRVLLRDPDGYPISVFAWNVGRTPLSSSSHQPVG
jgi:catechol 2,3-dioxygenase-like lactoylglutathione lyase family enzyme